jgi:hypothetical protein
MVPPTPGIASSPNHTPPPPHHATPPPQPQVTLAGYK